MISNGMAEQRGGVEEHWNDKQQQGGGKKRELCIGKELNSHGEAWRRTTSKGDGKAKKTK